MHSILNNYGWGLLDEWNRNSEAQIECPVTLDECSWGGRCNSENVVYPACNSHMEHNNDGERVYIGIPTGN